MNFLRGVLMGLRYLFTGSLSRCPVCRKDGCTSDECSETRLEWLTW